jgi:membrane protein implicated in regulation of membrane protease activity
MYDWGGIIGVAFLIIVAVILAACLVFVIVWYSALAIIWVARRYLRARKKPDEPMSDKTNTPTTKIVSVNWRGLKRFLNWKGAIKDLKRRKLP